MRQPAWKKDNSGMTLLEVIVAVSIFSIAAIVLFRGFISSGLINRKSNLYLEATSTAQNVMEEIKSRDFADVSLAFNYPVDQTTGDCRFAFLNPQLDKVQSGGLGLKEMLRDKNGFRDVRRYENSGGNETNVTASVISTDGGKTYKFNPRKKGDNASQYYFQMTNVTNLHEDFDVLVEFDGSAASGYKKKSALSGEKGKNDYLMPNISRLDTKTDAFLIMDRDWDQTAMDALLAGQYEEAEKRWSEAGEDYQSTHQEPQKLSYEDVYAHTRRILTVKLEESGGIVTAKAKYRLCAYDYTKAGGGDFETMSLCPCGGTNVYNDTDHWISGCFCTYESAYTSFYSSEAGADLKSLYVFFYPNYNSKSSVRPLDEIEFDNSINYPVSLHVTKQRNEAEKLPTSAQELSYRMALSVLETPKGTGNPNWNTSLSLYKARTVLRTNLDYDISDLTQAVNRPKITQMSLTYRDDTNKKAVGTSAKNVLSYNGLDDKTAADRIYTAKVSVYKAGAAAKDFQDGDDLIFTLDGAKEN